MNMLLLNLVLAILWSLMWGSFDIFTLGSGLVAGYLLLGLVTRTTTGSGYGSRVWKLLSFLVYFIRILIKANLQVAWEIITPGFNMHPKIVKYDVTDLTPAQITTLANSISLTPGTLSVDVADDERHLYVHCMYAKDRAAAVADLDELRDRIMREIFH